jgi:hypothetical protein
VHLTSTCIPAQLDHRAKVIALDEDFVPERPNPLGERRAGEAGSLWPWRLPGPERCLGALIPSSVIRDVACKLT